MRKLLIGDKDVSGMMKLDDNFVYVPFPKPFEIELLVVGGGGGGGENYTAFEPYNVGGGGGAGGMITGSYEVKISDSFAVTIGNGGIAGTVYVNSTNGGNSSIIGEGLSVIAYGGGRGGNPRTASGDRNGGNGGSGGGAGGTTASAGSVGTATIGSFPSGFSGFGNIGGGIYNCGSGTSAGGGGGGAASRGNSQNCNAVAGSGLSWKDGLSYARGGGSGTTAVANRGFGGAPGELGGQNGSTGVVKLRYAGQPKATGGTITQSGGYTYHTFTSADTFEVFSSFDVN